MKLRITATEMLVEFISTKFDEYEADRKKKDEMINSLEEKNFRID